MNEDALKAVGKLAVDGIKLVKEGVPDVKEAVRSLEHFTFSGDLAEVVLDIIVDIVKAVVSDK